MIKKNCSIGVFDSGFGGLTVLQELVKTLPNYNYIYLGDSARAPYGSRSQKTIYQFTEQAVEYLFNKNCQLIILACNTASSEALRKIQQEMLPQKYPNRKVLGVVVPASEQAVQITKNKKIGIIATEATVNSQAFPKQINKIDSNIKVFQQSAPLLVPIIEYGEHQSSVAETMLRKYLKPLLKKNIDTLVLGCTHYQILKNKIKKIVGKQIKVVIEGKIAGDKLENYLQRHPEINNKLSKQTSLEFLTTDLGQRFKRLGKLFFGKEIQPLKKISLKSYNV